MNTRVFKDISKYQHRAWLGFHHKTNHLCFTSLYCHNYCFGLESLFLAIWRLVCLRFCVCFYHPPSAFFGVYKPNDLYFEHYLKYRLHFELTIPLRTISGKKGLEHEKKIKYIKETKDFND